MTLIEMLMFIFLIGAAILIISLIVFLLFGLEIAMWELIKTSFGLATIIVFGIILIAGIYHDLWGLKNKIKSKIQKHSKGSKNKSSIEE